MRIVQPQPPQRPPLPLARRPEHLRAQHPRQLRSRHTHPASSSMNQHPLPTPQTREIHKPVIRRQEHTRHRRRLNEGPALRHPHKQTMISHRHRPKPTRQHTHHPITNTQPLHTHPDLQHHTRTLTHHRLTRIHPQRKQHITEVQTRRAYPHTHLADPERPRHLRRSDQPKILQRNPHHQPPNATPQPPPGHPTHPPTHPRPAPPAARGPPLPAQPTGGSPSNPNTPPRTPKDTSSSSTSTSHTLPGNSDCAERTKPHTPASAKEPTPPPAPTATAP